MCAFIEREHCALTKCRRGVIYIAVAANVSAGAAAAAALATMFHVQVDDADLHGLLYLSLNSTSKSAPNNAVNVPRVSQNSAQLSAPQDMITELLHTAVERGHTSQLSSILLSLKAFNAVTHEQLLPAMERAIVLDAGNHPRLYAPLVHRLHPLVCLPAAAQLSAEAVAALMNKALEVSLKCKEDFIISILQSLFKLPAARQLPSDTVAAVMNKAVEAPRRYGEGFIMKLLQILFKLPVAKLISGAQLAPMVEAAAAKGDTSSLQLLAAEAPAFHQLQPAAALRAAVEGGSMPALSVLLGSRAVAAADDVLVPALALAIRMDQKSMWRETVAKMLRALLDSSLEASTASAPTAGEPARFSTDGWSQALAEAVSSNRPDLFNRLWQHPAVASLQGQHLGQLLRCTAAVAAPAAASAIQWKAVHSLLQQHPAWAA